MLSKVFTLNATNFIRNHYQDVYHFALDTVYDVLPAELDKYQRELVKVVEDAYNNQNITYQAFSELVRAIYAVDGLWVNDDDLERLFSMNHLGMPDAAVNSSATLNIVRRCSRAFRQNYVTLDPDFIMCDHKLTDAELVESILFNHDFKHGVHYEHYASDDYLDVVLIERSDFIQFVKQELRMHRWHAELDMINNDEAINRFIKCYDPEDCDPNNLGNNIIEQLTDENEYILIKMRGCELFGTMEFIDKW